MSLIQNSQPKQRLTRPILKSLNTPVFIVGAPRSGTTWTQRLLLSFPGACGGPESWFFVAFAPALKTYEECDARVRRDGLSNYWSRKAFIEELRQLWYKTMLSHVKASPSALLVEKTPPHALCIDEIRKILPDSRFIHVIRDSRASVASMLAANRTEWGKDWAPDNARRAALQWSRYVLSAKKSFGTLPKNRCLELHYEDMLEDPISAVQRMSKLCGSDLGPEAVRRIVRAQDFAKQKESRGTPFLRTGELNGKSLREPEGFFRSGTPDSWRTDLSKEDQTLIWNLTGDIMRTVGYNKRGRLGRRPRY